MSSIASRLSVFMALVVFGLLMTLGATSTALNQLRIGGQSYRVIVDAKDLVADILPPPLYVIEAYLEVKLAAEQPQGIADHRARLTQLKNDFDTRREFWRASALQVELRKQLTEIAGHEADVFWEEVFHTFLPALEAGRIKETDTSVQRLDEAYRRHRKASDDTVIAATDFQTNAEHHAEDQNIFWNIVLYSISGGVAALVIAGALGVKLLVMRPLTAMTAAMRELAGGNDEVVVPARGRRDEIGSMAAALQTFKDNAIEQRQLEKSADADRRALEDAREAMERQRADNEVQKTQGLLAMVEQVERETKGAVSTVVSLMDDMTTITLAMSDTACTLSANAETVAEAANEAQLIMQSAKEATENLSASIDKVATQVRTTHDVTAKAVQASENTGRSIEALSNVVNEITGVTKIITDIARQTHLLAINAGVEATRSGQDGRGFAVIALEVKTLSEQTSGATNKIADLVRQVHASTGGAVHAVTEISRTIQSVNAAAEEMAGAIGHQVDMTRKIAVSVNETTSAAAQVTSRVQQIAAEARASGVQAQQVDDMCHTVAEQARALHVNLIKIVRTCSEEIDRRSFHRTATDIEADIEVNRRRKKAVITDISLGGIQVADILGRIGEAVMVRIPGLPSALRGTIVHCSETATHVRFELTQPDRAALESLFGGSALRLRAA